MTKLEQQFMDDPAASYWLKENIVKSQSRDPNDMLNDLEALTEIVNDRFNNSMKIAKGDQNG